MPRRAATSLLACALLSGLVGGCSGDQPDAQPDEVPGASAPAGETSASTAPAEPRSLVGTWRATATGQKGTIRLLEVSRPELRLWVPCGELGGSWDADSAGTFVAYTYSSHGRRCQQGAHRNTPAWLAAATSFAEIDNVIELRDADGEITAVLRPAKAQPESPPRTGLSLKRLPSALPAGLRAAEASRLLHRTWIPVDWYDGIRRAPFVRFHRDRRLSGSDGCNSQSGRYTLAPDGLLVSVHGFQTLIGCEGDPVGSWVDSATRVALDGATLVLLDKRGDEVARLRAVRSR